jgi:Ca2+/H+ antiporter
MRIFKAIVVLAWIAVALNLVLSMVFRAYSRHVPYEIEGVLFITALVLFAAYKIRQLYRAGMNRSNSR